MTAYKIPILILLLFCLSQTSLSSQNIDSLKASLQQNSPKNSPQQNHLLQQIATAYKNVNLDSAQYYAAALMDRAEKTADKEHLAKAYCKLAEIYNMQGKYQEAVEPIKKGIDLGRQLQAREGLAGSIYLRGNILQNLHQYEAAEKSYLESFGMAQQYQDTLMMGKNMQGMAINKYELGKIEEAINYYFKAVDLFVKINKQNQLASCYTNIGRLFATSKQYDKSIDYYNKAVEIKRQMKNYRGLAITYYNLASLLISITIVRAAFSS